MDEIRKLTDEQLVNRLKEFGEIAGPLTSSTRMIFERRLWKHVNPSPTPINPANDYQVGVDSPRPPVPAVSRIEQAGMPAGVQKKLVPSDDERPPDVYYGVQLPLEAKDKETCCVFINKIEAMRFMKKYPGSRFNMFDARDKAARFSKRIPEVYTSTSATNQQRLSPKPSSNGQPGPPPPPRQPPSEGSEYRSVKTQDLVKLRKLLESGDVVAARTLMWSNPRYLITSGDTPTILQEGFRYNALHVCAWKNQAPAAQLILDTLQDREFMRRLYPGEPLDTRELRIQFLVDMYLNTPDKGNCESALHFACKYGHVSVVEVLTAYPQVDRQRTNRNGDSPGQIICTRAKVPSADLTERIQELLGDRFFVPLYRTDDHSAPPHISSPWSPTVDGAPRGWGGSPVSSTGSPGVPPNSPRDSPLCVKAYAGPMSGTQAKRFHKHWLTPPSVSPKERREIADVRRRDSEKGMERIGRSVARSLKVPWAEFWDFLGCFCDFSTAEGLAKLESYLGEQWASQERHNELEDDLAAVAERLNRLQLSSSPKLVLYLGTDSDLLEETPDETPAPRVNLSAQLEEEQSDEQKESEQKPNGIDNQSCDMSSTNQTTQNLNDQNSSQKPSSELDNSVLTGNQLHNDLTNTDKNLTNTDKNLTNYEKDLLRDFNLNPSSLAHRSAADTHSDADSSASGDTFYTAMDVDQSDVESLFTPPQSMSPVHSGQQAGYYIYGSAPHKIDVDVLRALEGIPISGDAYPRIHQWRQGLLGYREEDRRRWGTPKHIRVAQGNQYTSTPGRGGSGTPYGKAYNPGSYHSPGLPYRSPSLSFSSPGSVSDSDSSFGRSSDDVSHIRANLMASFLSEK